MSNILKITVTGLKCFYSASNVGISCFNFGNKNKFVVDSRQFSWVGRIYMGVGRINVLINHSKLNNFKVTVWKFLKILLKIGAIMHCKGLKSFEIILRIDWEINSQRCFSTVNGLSILLLFFWHRANECKIPE